MGRVLNKIKTELQNVKLGISYIFSQSKDKVENNVPYVSQFAHPEFAEKILKDRVEKASDPNWQNTGAKSPDEYAEWVLVMCGMACTSMALQYFKGNNKGIVSLAKEALKHEVYDKEFSGISDMKYKEFANWIGNYGVRAEVYTRLNIRGLYKLLSDGNLVMVSVNPNVRGYKTAEAHQKGGHLVLVIGYDKKMKTLTLHNPSGFVSHSTQENHTISVREFIKYYAGRGIALSTLGK